MLTGYGVVEGSKRGVRLLEAGTIRSPRSQGLTERLEALYKGLREVLSEFSPQVMALEELYSHYRHPRTAILMGHARGALLLAAAHERVAVKSFSATRVKSAVSGSGRASKHQIQRTVMSRLNLKKLPHPPDVADAIAIALCCLETSALPLST